VNESLNETAYLLASPANADRLNEAVEELRNGGGESRDLIDPDSGPDETAEAVIAD
jgi:antitoxin YefM